MTGHEKKKHQRVDVAASAVIGVPGGNMVRYAVGELSVGGALLRGSPPLAPSDPVRMMLYLGGGRPLVVDADVVRQFSSDRGEPVAAVTFRDLSPADEDAIQDGILRALEAMNGPNSRV